MPLDPSIILGGRAPAPMQGTNPLDFLSTVERVQSLRELTEQRRLAGEERRAKAQAEADARARALQTEQTLQSAMTLGPDGQPTVNWDKLLGHIPSDKLFDVKQKIDEATQRVATLRTTNLTAEEKAVQYQGIVARPVAAGNYDKTLSDQAVNAAFKAGAITAADRDAGLALTDPAAIKRMIDTAVQRAQEQKLEKIDTVDAQGHPVQQFVTPTLGATYLKAPPAGSAEEKDKERYRGIAVKAQQGQPVTPEEAAWAKAYEREKTLTTDTSASYAANRQASAIGAQVAQQQRAQDFTQLQAARADIRENVDKPYATAKSGAETLRDVVTAAQHGNKLAGSLQNLEATMAAIKAQGLNRINMPEIAATGHAGSLWDNIASYVGQKAEGQPVPASIQKDMLEFATILDKAAAKKAKESHDASNKLYGTQIPYTYPYDAVAAPPAAPAPKEGTPGVVNGVPAVWKTVNGKAGWYKQ